MEEGRLSSDSSRPQFQVKSPGPLSRNAVNPSIGRSVSAIRRALAPSLRGIPSIHGHKKRCLSTVFISWKCHLEEAAAADCAVDRGKFLQSDLRVVGVTVDYHIADLFVGLQVLASDIDLVVGKDVVDL